MFVGRPEDHRRLLRSMNTWPVNGAIMVGGAVLSWLMWGWFAVLALAVVTVTGPAVAYVIASRRRT